MLSVPSKALRGFINNAVPPGAMAPQPGGMPRPITTPFPPATGINPNPVCATKPFPENLFRILPPPKKKGNLRALNVGLACQPVSHKAKPGPPRGGNTQTSASVAQLDRASDFGSEGYRFKSCRTYQFRIKGLQKLKDLQLLVFPDNSLTSQPTPHLPPRTARKRRACRSSLAQAGQSKLLQRIRFETNAVVTQLRPSREDEQASLEQAASRSRARLAALMARSK